MARSIGLDVHRDFCQVAIADGGRARSAGQIKTTPEQLELFAQSLAPTDCVVMEATGNALAIARILEPHVAEVVLAHAKQVRAISHARIKTDTIDAKILADLLAADLIPAVWIGDERCRMVRRLVSRRRELVKRRTQIKNEISAVLHRNLKGRSSASDPFGNKGRGWIAEQQLPIDERLTVDAGLRQLDFVGGELAEIDRVIAQEVLGDRAPDLRPAARARTSRPLRGGTIICSPTRPRPVHCSRSRERSSRGGRPERDRKSSVPAAGVFIASCLHCSQAQDVARSFAA